MKKPGLPIIKSYIFLIGIFFLLTISQSVARADELFTKGYTNGCFGCTNPPNFSATQFTTQFGLTYTNSTFEGTTSAGIRALGGNPQPPPTQGLNNFGSFDLSSAPSSYSGETFTLRVTFTAPQGIAGTNTLLLSASIKGVVRDDDIGGLLIDFDNLPIKLTYDDTNCENDPTGGLPGQDTTCGSGEFYLTINDLAIDPTQTEALTGYISQTAPVSACDQQIQTLQDQIDQLESQLSTANQTIQSQQQQIADQQAQIQSLTNQISQLQTQLTSANQTIQLQQGQIQSLQTQVTQLTTQLNTANQTIQNQQAQIQSLQSQVNQLQLVIINAVNIIQQNFRQEFRDPQFTIPGANALQQFQNLLNAIQNLNQGHKNALYKALGGKR